MRDYTRGAQNINFREGLRWYWCHQKVDKRSWCRTCLIEQVIPPRVDFKHKMLIPTKCVHYTSEASFGLFWNTFRKNLRPVKPCAVIKGTRWLKNNVSLIWDFFFNVPELPSPYSTIYIIFATSQLPRPQNSRVHCNVLSEYIQVTS